MDMYGLIILRGLGETAAKVVTAEDMGWIKASDLTSEPPAATIERWKQLNPDYEYFVDVTPGSWENDRAVWLPGVIVDGKELCEYCDMSDCMDAINRWEKLLKVKKWKAGTYEGCTF